MLFKVAGATQWSYRLGALPGLACLGLLAGLCLFTAALGGGLGMLAGWPPSAPSAVTQLQVRITLPPQLVIPGSRQEVLVAVQDQAQRPVRGASINLTVHEPGQDRQFVFPLTNDQGQASLAFAAAVVPSGTIIPIAFQVSYPGCPMAQIVGSYLVWEGPPAEPDRGHPITSARVDCARQDHLPIRLGLLSPLDAAAKAGGR